MIVLKEFPAKYRTPLQRLMDAGFARVPSMPMTTLDIDYRNFEDYLSHCLSPRTRGKVRRKLRAAERAQPTITVEVVTDAAPYVDDIYPLYEKVFERSPLQFEKLTREFLRDIGPCMPDKVRFFLWRQDSRIVAFGLCTVQGDRICHEYVGFDYAVAFELNLYHRVFHDIVEWAIANGYKRFYSGSLNYGTCATRFSPLICTCGIPPFRSMPCSDGCFPMEPTRSDPILPNFHNYRDLWD
jgi:predicted N-acyltransferase